jgi:hypothetical protein
MHLLVLAAGRVVMQALSNLRTGQHSPIHANKPEQHSTPRFPPGGRDQSDATLSIPPSSTSTMHDSSIRNNARCVYIHSRANKAAEPAAVKLGCIDAGGKSVGAAGLEVYAGTLVTISKQVCDERNLIVSALSQLCEQTCRTQDSASLSFGCLRHGMQPPSLATAHSRNWQSRQAVSRCCE